MHAAKAAGCADIRFHALRHYCAKRLDEMGMSSKLRSEVIGHSSENITNGIDTLVTRERISAAADAFDPLA